MQSHYSYFCFLVFGLGLSVKTMSKHLPFTQVTFINFIDNFVQKQGSMLTIVFTFPYYSLSWFHVFEFYTQSCIFISRWQQMLSLKPGESAVLSLLPLSPEGWLCDFLWPWTQHHIVLSRKVLWEKRFIRKNVRR